MALRILMVTDYYPPLIGGTELQVQYLGKELRQRGHEIRVATVWQPGTAEHGNDEGMAVDRIKGISTRVPWFSKDPNKRHHPPFPDPAIVLELRRIIQEFRPDVVHAFCWIAYSCAAALIGSRVPLVVSLQEYGYACPTRNLLHRGRICDGPSPLKCLQCSAQRYGAAKALVATSGVFGFKPLLRRKVVAVHAISEFTRQVIEPHLAAGQAERRKPLTLVIPPVHLRRDGIGEDAERIQPYLAQLPQVPFILYVGSLQPHKGIGVLLASYRELDAPPPLVLMGPVWPDSPREFPEGVQVLQNVPHGAVMAAWRRCLFGVAPSLWAEPFGGVVAEAMSVGKAIIGTRPGGHTDMIVDGETGLLADAGDVPGLARAMRRLIDDAGLRRRLGHSASERVRTTFTAEAVLPRFEEFYSSVVGGTNRQAQAVRERLSDPGLSR